MRFQNRLLVLAAVLALGIPGLAAAQGTLFVEGDNVGIGTDTPATSLHVLKSDGTAKIRVEETSSTVQARELFQLVNNGGPFFIFADSNLGQSYSFAMGGTGDFIISQQQHPGVEFRMTSTGNVTILGSLSQGSSRTIKQGIDPVEPSAVLKRVIALPIDTWSYKADGSSIRHLGPMAEDFRSAFGLGNSDKTISTIDTSGVALAAVQGLYELVQDQHVEIETLKGQIAELQAAAKKH